MVHLALAFVAAALVSVQASPLYYEKRIAQTIDQSMTLWQAACLAATSNSLQCNPLAVAAFSTLLAGADTCAQQNASDNLIDFAKQQPNSGQMIPLAQLFSQQPRNSPTSLFTPYCTTPPRNSELNGLYQCQFDGAGPGFAAGTPGDSAKTPLGLTSVNPPGSCPANPNGPITAGSQLSSITTNPFASGSGNATSSGSDSGTPTSSGSDSGTPTSSGSESGTPTSSGSDSGTPTSSDNSSGSTPTSTSSDSGTTASSDPDSCPAPLATQSPGPSEQANDRDLVSSPPSTSTTGMAAPAASSTSGSFQLGNGQDAQKLNAQFASLTADSPCSAGAQGCINTDFAQCVSGKYVLQPCAPSLSCYALPLILKSGTSIACTTEADAQQRIANTGATGGITGSG